MKASIYGGLAAAALLAVAPAARANLVSGMFTGDIITAVPGLGLAVGDAVTGTLTYQTTSFVNLSSDPNQFLGLSTAQNNPFISIMVDGKTYSAGATSFGQLNASNAAFNGQGHNSFLLASDNSSLNAQSNTGFRSPIGADLDFTWPTTLAGSSGEVDVFSPVFAAIDFSVSSISVPEPTTVLILVSGLAGLAMVRRRST